MQPPFTPNDFSSARVLVTGGAGFIGSALTWALNARGCSRIVLCDLLGSDEKWRNLTPLRFEDYVEAPDLLPQLTSGSLGAFDLVLHLGACSATTECDASYLIRNNYEFSKQLAHWALATGARFVYASSAATYGDGAQGMSDLAPLEPLRPLNMYGYSKHLFDLYAQRHGFLGRIVGLKYFNVYGPNEDHKAEMRSLVHKATTQARQEGVIRLFRSQRPDFRDGEQQRDFLYVKDAAAITLHLAGTQEAGGLYNVGSGEARTWLDLAHAIFAALGQEPKIEFIDLPAALQGKYQYYTKADIHKLRGTGYHAPISSVEEAVRDYVCNYLVPDLRLGHEAPPASTAAAV